MSIHVECPECFRPYEVPDRYAGQKVRCKACGAAMPVPPVAAETESAADSLDFASPKSARAAAPAVKRGIAAPNRTLLWWGIGAAAVFLLVVLAVSFLTPLGLLIALGLFVIGMLILTIGQIFLIVAAFQEDVTQGLLVFFVPIYPLFYLFSRWPKTSLSVWLYAAGTVVALLSIPSGVGGTIATARWANTLDRSNDGTDSGGTVVAVEHPAPPVDPRFAGFAPDQMPGPNGFPHQPGFPPPGFPPNGMPPGVMPPGAMPPGTMPPGFPPEAPGTTPLNEPDVAVSIRADTLKPGPITLYLRGTNSYFDRSSDLQSLAEEHFAEIAGYVTGTARIDLAQGQVLFEAPQNRGTITQASHALFRIGLMAGERPSPLSWNDPTQPQRITMTIRTLLPAFDELGDAETATDELLREVDGYVAGSIALDTEAKQLSFEAYPGSPAARFGNVALLRAGINAVPNR